MSLEDSSVYVTRVRNVIERSNKGAWNFCHRDYKYSQNILSFYFINAFKEKFSIF